MPEDQYPPQTGSGVYPGFADPDWQRRAEQQQIEIYKRAKNIQQAEADVSAARRMLGIMKADREVQSGVPVDKAMFNNLHYFTSPRDKGFADTVQQLRPLPPPYATNFPGMTAPVVVAPTRQGQTVHFPPSSALPQPKQPTEIKGVPVINPDGTTNKNFVGVPNASGKGFVLRPTKAEGPKPLTPHDKMLLIKDQIKEKEAELDSLQNGFNIFRNNKTDVDRVTKELNALKQQRNTLGQSAASPTRIRVRDKSSGRLGWWEGSEALPGQYEKVE